MPTTDLRVIHSSQQFSDSNVQHAQDAETIFAYADKQKALFLTGTEAGNSKQNHDLRDALVAAAKKYGWRINAHRWGDWVATNAELAKVTDRGWVGPLIPGTTGLTAPQGAHSPRGITWVTAEVPNVGPVTMGCVHYLTARSKAASKTTNQPLADGIAAWGVEKGKGKAIVLINGDWNMDDERKDVFLGKPFTTSWDELGKHPATHGRDKAHGSTIDACASYDADKAVRAKSARSLDDSDLQLNTDHFAIETVWTVTR
jgi:hypothetical protein